ncbi:hypothetical protein TNCT_599611 [Trichonephila clavata]|uniref:Uncharacterized protein n=1 Tax=Trichonephila clavata TaxID=2740835 RepID=A0A8X6GY82_TRICU|nr:hypothetical protein TNCT_599611 [Trichonephila clavata]
MKLMVSFVLDVSDYHNLKPRKSENKRQTLLLALKASPSIETLKDLSTKEEKFYKLLRKTKNLPFFTDSGMPPCKNEIAEISVESPFSTSMDVHYKTTNLESINSAPNENDVLEIEETFKDLSEMLGYNADSILNIGGEASAVSFGGEASAVPDSTSAISEYFNDNISQSMFVQSFNANSSCNSNLIPDVSDQHEIENQAYPDDYDPSLDLFQSIENKKTFSQKIPVCYSKSSEWEVKGVYSVSNDVVKLLDKGNEKVSDHFNPNYYIMTLKSSKS